MALSWLDDLPRPWPTKPDSARARFILAAGVTTALLVIFACGAALRSVNHRPLPHVSAPGERSAELLNGLDPNVAPWWELTALPRVGPSRARAIVAFRETWTEEGPAFPTADSLERVHGIGPKTVARLRPQLILPAGVEHRGGDD